jgi:hypothetical protein
MIYRIGGFLDLLDSDLLTLKDQSCQSSNPENPDSDKQRR